MAVRGKLIVNNIRNVRRNLSVLSNLRRARQANAFDKPAMLGTVSARVQIPSRTTHKDTGTKVNTYYYFIS